MSSTIWKNSPHQNYGMPADRRFRHSENKYVSGQHDYSNNQYLSSRKPKYSQPNQPVSNFSTGYNTVNVHHKKNTSNLTSKNVVYQANNPFDKKPNQIRNHGSSKSKHGRTLSQFQMPSQHNISRTISKNSPIKSEKNDEFKNSSVWNRSAPRQEHHLQASQHKQMNIFTPTREQLGNF